jgi:POT family proton-dependent oligopeptide transporter
MPKRAWFTAPLKTSGMPPGIPFIIGNEAAERFTYYGLRGILVVFMTKYLFTRTGQPDFMSDENAKVAYHNFISAVYFFPLLGGLLADSIFGKYRTIVWLSVVYCIGAFALFVDSTRTGLFLGLTLIAIGSGGIKPCVSAHVGDQFGATNQHLLPRVFSWFYFSINFGSTFSMMLIPYLLAQYGARAAFALPFVLMILATWVFWLGRYRFAHIPPGGRAFLHETFSKEGLRSIGQLLVIYLFVAVFWSLWDQTASAWVLQAEHMDRHAFGREWLPAQVQTLNPIFTLTFIPLFSYVIYPLLNKVFPLTPLRKISIGLFVTALPFLVSAWVESQITLGLHPYIGWQALGHALMTSGEILVSITCLEFSYTQAPRKMKSVIMSIYLLSVSLGNQFTALVNRFIQNADGTSKLPGASYYMFFTVLMLATAIAFIFVAYRYKESTYIQEEMPQTA